MPELEWEYTEDEAYDVVATLEKIVARCKAGVHIDINGHQGNRETIAEYLEHYADDEDLTPAERQRIIDAGIVYRLQFYPDTPIGFHWVFGASLDEVVTKALAILRE